MPMPEPIFSCGNKSDIQVDIQVEQQAKPRPLIILAIMMIIELVARVYPMQAIMMQIMPNEDILYLLILSA